MARLKLGPGFTLIPVATGGGHLSDVHTGDALVVPQADMVLLQQTAVSGLDLKTPGARELLERYRPFLAESEGGDAFYELDFDDAPTLAPVTSADPRPSPSRAASLGPLIAEELRREEPIGTLIAEELTEPGIPALAIPPPPPSSPKYVTRVATPIAEKPEAVTQTTPALAPLPAGPPPMEPEPWSIEPAPQAFVPLEAQELAQKVAQQPFSFDAQSTDLHPRLPTVSPLAEDDEPMAELEELPPEEQDAVTGEPLPAEAQPSPSAGADVLALVGQPVFERTPSWSESPVPEAPTLPAGVAPVSLPDAPTLPGGVLPPELFAPPPTVPAPDVTQSQADHLRQALHESGVAPSAPPVSVPEPSAPPPAAAARGKALTFTLAGIAVLVVGVGVTMALKPGSETEVPAVVDAGVARTVTPPVVQVEAPDADVEVEVVTAPTVDAGAVVATRPEVVDAGVVATSEWNEAPVQARGRVKMAQVVAGDDGVLAWSVGDGQRVKTKQAVGTLTRAKGELSLVADNVGLLMIKQPAGEVKKGDVLAHIIYFEAWAKASLKGRAPTSAWKCEVASAAKGQQASCKISVVTPKPGGAQVTVAVEPMWFDDAADAVLRVAP